MKRIYLDYNSTTPVHPDVIEEVSRHLKDCIGNPSSIHSFGKEAYAKLLNARQKIADALQVSPRELIFTSGATEALNLVIRGIVEKNPGCHVISSDLEHSSVYNTLQILMKKKQCAVSFIKSNAYGAPNPEQVRETLSDKTKLIVLMAANNETGVITDYEKIASIAEGLNIHFVVDATALLGKVPIFIPKGVSSMCFSGHKCYAPKGIGLCFIRSSVKIEPIISGGGQEFQRRAGTENLPGIVGFAKSIEFISQNQAQACNQMLRLRDKLEQMLKANLDGVEINGLGPRIVNTSNLSFDGVDGETLLTLLDMEGVCASHGSACASGALEPSRVLRNMGLSKERIASSIRFSVGYFSREHEIDRAVDIVTKVVKRLRK